MDKNILARALVKVLNEAGQLPKTAATYRKRLDNPQYLNRVKRQRDVMRTYHEMEGTNNGQ